LDNAGVSGLLDEKRNSASLSGVRENVLHPSCTVEAQRLGEIDRFVLPSDRSAEMLGQLGDMIAGLDGDSCLKTRAE